MALLLSYRRYLEDKLTGFLRSCYEKGKFITGTVVEKKDDGYVVDVSGLKVFLPMKELHQKPQRRQEDSGKDNRV